MVAGTSHTTAQRGGPRQAGRFCRIEGEGQNQPGMNVAVFKVYRNSHSGEAGVWAATVGRRLGSMLTGRQGSEWKDGRHAHQAFVPQAQKPEAAGRHPKTQSSKSSSPPLSSLILQWSLSQRQRLEKVQQHRSPKMEAKWTQGVAWWQESLSK